MKRGVSFAISFWLVVFSWSCSAVVARPAPMTSVAQATTSTGNQRPKLRSGSQGAAVSELQASLKLLGYYKGAVDGVYNESTVIAVSQFQQAAGLNPDGIVGPETWERLFPPTPPTSSTTSTDSGQAGAKQQPRAADFPVPSTAKPTAPVTPTVSTATSTRPYQNPVSGSGVIGTSNPTLRLGMRGSAVTKLQQQLQAIGLFDGSIDGDFGPATEAAVKAVQQRYGIAPDGIVGPTTWAALLGQASRR